MDGMDELDRAGGEGEFPMEKDFVKECRHPNRGYR